MKSSFCPFSLLCLVNAVSAATVFYNFNITWVEANPDNRLTRPVVGINNQWPNPIISGNIGDTIVVKVENGLGNETTSLHWHGWFRTKDF